MIRPGFTPGNRAAADIGPAPRRDAFPDEYSFLLANIVWERGGLDRFGAVAREAAAAMAALMCEMRICPPGELARNIEALAKMEAKLPPAVNIDRGPDLPRRSIRDTPLAELVVEYQRTLAGDPTFEMDDEPSFAAPAARPPPPSEPPGPAATAMPPEPEAAPGPPQGADNSFHARNEFPPEVAGEVVLVPVPRPDLDEPPAPPRREHGGYMKISQELLRKVDERPDQYGGVNSTGFTDMQTMLRSQGWRR